ncbi:hypothetical protein C5E51_16410 [Nocardia nova]|uniref:helix-turn-helix domain-containing protein n=1 Tax=Nocardia nova TaxID=37330 RepID=UPI000CEA6F39|nr:helix-turn-helix domain-containing protein [Nocardia nova]PPJ08748.1 hypothetical protein C5E51_16410 [Nocardia nova]
MAREARKPVISIGEIEAYKNKGWSQSDIARAYGVTRQYISWIKHRYNGTLSPREQIMQHWMITVPHRMTQASPYQRLRDHGEYRATGGEGMTDNQLNRLRGFYSKLRNNNTIVEFDPELPPEHGVSTSGGWAYRPRSEEDGQLLLRENAHTSFTDAARSIWSFPPIEP